MNMEEVYVDGAHIGSAEEYLSDRSFGSNKSVKNFPQEQFPKIKEQNTSYIDNLQKSKIKMKPKIVADDLDPKVNALKKTYVTKQHLRKLSK